SEMSTNVNGRCFDDGVQIATGCTYAKDLYTRLNYGKYAIILFKPGIGAVRVSIKPEFFEKLINGPARKCLDLKAKGMKPSQFSSELYTPVLEVLETTPDEEMFQYKFLSSFRYVPKRVGTGWRKCDSCGEYVVESEGKIVENKFYCKACYYGYKDDVPIC
ncbi:FmdE family protein, partial [Acidianus sp. RZ1]|uniref:FmdE family protein n=1 Tax=Acidianus sp. RZ1 TaxID=1540082 RepID=UPI001491A6C7